MKVWAYFQEFPIFLDKNQNLLCDVFFGQEKLLSPGWWNLQNLIES